MIIEQKVPSPGESITEVTIAQWLVKDGDYVETDDELAEVDSDKATLTINAEANGAIKLIAKEGDTVNVGQVICKIDTSVKGEKKAEAVSKKAEVKNEKPEAKASPAKSEAKSSYAAGTPSPSAKKIIDENGVAAANVNGTGKGGRITKGDVLVAMSKGFDTNGLEGWTGSRDVERQKTSALRKKLAQRLVAVKNQTAMLTTFNEIDMSGIYAMRAKYKEKFKECINLYIIGTV